MDTENKGVKETLPNAPAVEPVKVDDQGIKETTPVVPTGEKGNEDDAKDNELLTAVESLLAINKKLVEDRDNYRAAALLNKGKGDTTPPADGAPAVDPSTLREIIREEIKNNLQPDDAQKIAEAVKKTLAENKELKVALKHRSQVQNGGLGGGSTDQPSPEVRVLTAEQIADLKKRNPTVWTDERIKQLEERLKNNR